MTYEIGYGNKSENDQYIQHKHHKDEIYWIIQNNKIDEEGLFQLEKTMNKYAGKKRQYEYFFDGDSELCAHAIRKNNPSEIWWIEENTYLERRINDDAIMDILNELNKLEKEYKQVTEIQYCSDLIKALQYYIEENGNDRVIIDGKTIKDIIQVPDDDLGDSGYYCQIKL